MLLSLHLPSPPPSGTFQNKPLYIKFRTSYRENLRYLQTLSIIPPNTAPNHLPLPAAVDSILSTLNFLKSHSFSDSDVPRLHSSLPSLFSPSSSTSLLHPSHLSAVLRFLSSDVRASPAESRLLVLRCPHLLLAHPDLMLRPTFRFLRFDIGLKDLNKPTNRNAHLLNTRVESLRVKLRFLMDEAGLDYVDAVRSLGRLPAIFGYGLESNLRPKLEYLVGEMERDVDELKRFPQFFGFSLERRIVPRHLHLKHRGINGVPLNKMLMWSDDKFYAKWN